jgi:Delta3-Delta2-enoyl-CoA isomerase
METLNIRNCGLLTEINLDRGKANPINHRMILELTTTIQDLLENPKVHGVLLSGKPGFFTAGLDVKELVELDKKGLSQFWIDFITLLRHLVGFPKPLAAAITGHSPAGGCVLSLCCDYSVMAKGAFRIGLNELQVGIVVPEIIRHLLGFKVGSSKAWSLLMGAKMLSPEEALNWGLVDEVSDSEEVIDRCQSQLNQWLKFNPSAWQKTKINLKRELLTVLEAPVESIIEETLAHWWSPGGRENLIKVVASLESSWRTPLRAFST